MYSFHPAGKRFGAGDFPTDGSSLVPMLSVAEADPASFRVAALAGGGPTATVRHDLGPLGGANAGTEMLALDLAFADSDLALPDLALAVPTPSDALKGGTGGGGIERLGPR